MGRFDVCRFVTRRRRIGEDTVEEILAGRVPEGSEHAAHVARFVSDLRTTFVAGSVEDGAVTALVEAGHVAREKGDLPATVASNAHGPAVRQGAGLPNWKRRSAVLSTFISSLLGRVAIGAAATTLSVGAAGASNALPQPLQRVVSDAAGELGIDMPSPDDPQVEADDPEDDGADQTADDSTPDTTAPEAEDDSEDAPDASDDGSEDESSDDSEDESDGEPSDDSDDDSEDESDDESSDDSDHASDDDGAEDQGDDHGHEVEAPEPPEVPEVDEPDEPEAPEAPEIDEPDEPEVEDGSDGGKDGPEAPEVEEEGDED